MVRDAHSTEYIVFEGIDGSGKSTQAALFTEHLRDLNYSVRSVREPGGTRLAEKIRSLLLDPEHDIHPFAEFQLFQAARMDLLDNIEQSNADIAVYDRGPLSTWAYQVYGRSSQDDRMTQTFYDLLNEFPSHRTYIFDIDFKTAMSRRAGDQDRMEAEDKAFYHEVIEGYKNPPESMNTTRFDATQSIPALEHKVLSAFLNEQRSTAWRTQPRSPDVQDSAALKPGTIQHHST